MRSIQLGVAIGLGLCGLLLATLWVSAQTIAPLPTPQVAEPPVSAAQNGPLALTATVGLDQNSCGVTDTIHVRANTPVHHCFVVHNTGSETLTSHVVSSTVRATAGLPAVNWTLTITPDRIITVWTQVPELTFVDAANRDVTNTITWTARSANSTFVVTATDQVTIDVAGPALSVIKTVGQNRAVCSTATTLRIPTGQNAFFCLTLQNQGDTPLVRHTVSDRPLNLTSSFDYNLLPGARLVITAGTTSVPGSWFLLQRNLPTTNTVTVTSTTASELDTSGSSSAILEVGSTTVQFTKTVGTDPSACPTATTVSAASGARLYYCVTIRNTGPVTLTHHDLVELPLSIDLHFDYTLTPGSLVTVTNDFLAANRQPVVFGPFEFSTRFPNVVNSTMTYTGTAPGGFRVNANSFTRATFLSTPTPTPTDRPDPTDTPTPFPTFTPSITPIPPTPTASPTPTFTPVTPTPTETRSYAITRLETPTPSQPFAQPTPFTDPAFFPLTLTAQAAAGIPAAPFDSPLDPFMSPLTTPVFDPFLSPVATPTLDPFLFPPTPLPAFDSPLQTPVPTPSPAETLLVALPPTPVTGASATPAVVVVVVTDTPAPEAGAWPPGQRPVVPPTATPTPDYVMFAATTLDSFLLTAGWIWFLAGSLIFFVAAGIVAGLFFRQQEVRRFDLIEGDLEDGALMAPQPPAPERERRADTGEWPDSLP